MAIIVKVTNERRRQTKHIKLEKFDKLTARAARVARTLTFGPKAHVTITDGWVTYRVTKGDTKVI